jgi:hypothetical protein
VTKKVVGVFVRFFVAPLQLIQRKDDTDIITWETTQYGGHLLVTLDSIVEHGIQQITHLDNYVDKLIFWLTGENVSGTFQIPAENYRLNYNYFIIR